MSALIRQRAAMPDPFFFRPPRASRLKEFVLVCHQCEQPNPEFRLSLDSGRVFVRLHCPRCHRYEAVPAVLVKGENFEGEKF